MSITCKDLLQLKLFKNITLAAGAEGLSHVITWPYVAQTDTISDWVHGGELLFVTGIAHTENMLPELLEECIRKKLAGLVILTGSEYISQLPPYIIHRADEAKFPVFVMPWEIKLIDVTREITNLIVYDQLERKKIRRFLGYLLFSPVTELQQAIDNAALETITIHKYNFVAIFSLSQILPAAEKDTLEEKLQQQIEALCQAQNILSYTMIYGSSVIVLVSATDKQQINKQQLFLKNARAALSSFCNDEHLLLALGTIYKDPKNIRSSYEEALSTLHIMQKMRDLTTACYQELGIYRLLLQLQENEELSIYYKNQLDKLISYDKDNAAGLLDTLAAYLETRGNITRTAQKLYIHRNTLLYRLNKIQELLHKDLDDARTCMELYLAIIIKDFLNHEE